MAKEVVLRATRSLNDLGERYLPDDFVWSTIQLNENYLSRLHCDRSNLGRSYIIGLGEYTGGELYVCTCFGIRCLRLRHRVGRVCVGVCACVVGTCTWRWCCKAGVDHGVDHVAHILAIVTPSRMNRECTRPVAVRVCVSLYHRCRIAWLLLPRKHVHRRPRYPRLQESLCGI